MASARAWRSGAYAILIAGVAVYAPAPSRALLGVVEEGALGLLAWRALTVVRAACERWDGQGFPDGLAGEAIPLGARIIAACGASPEERHDGAGTRFDPRIVKVAHNLDTVVSG